MAAWEFAISAIIAQMSVFYVAVINRWLCPDCFYEWYILAERYKEDIPIELKNYERFKSLFQ